MRIDLHRNRDFLAGLLFAFIGALAVIVARDYPMGTASRMGSGYFPTVLGGILVLFGAWLMVRGMLSGEQVRGDWAWKALAWIALAIVSFGYFMDRFGLVPALVAVFFASAAGGREFRFKEVLALTVVMSLFAVGTFVYALGLPYRFFGAW